MTNLNLEELERLLKEATPLPWIRFGGAIRDNSESRVLICSGVHCKIDVATRDHALIAAAVNALPELIRRVREAEKIDASIKYLLDNCPHTIRENYKMAGENIEGSLSITFLKMQNMLKEKTK